MKSKNNFNRNFMRSPFLYCGLTLILIVMVLNLVARIVAKVFSPKTGR